MCCLLKLRVPVVALVLLCGIAALAQGPTYNLGRTPTAEESRVCCIPITPAGEELPPGSGTAQQGAKIYAQKCAVCHGPTGAEGPWHPLVAGEESRGQEPPSGTELQSLARGLRGRLFATTIWDYINRYMPPRKRPDWKGGRLLSADEVYALTAFLLYRNDIIRESDVMDAQSLPKVQMPARRSYHPPPGGRYRTP